MSLVEISPFMLDNAMKIWKVYVNKDDRKLATLDQIKAYLGIRLRWAKNQKGSTISQEQRWKKVPWNSVTYGQKKDEKRSVIFIYTPKT